jgi:predicted glycosyltransferase
MSFDHKSYIRSLLHCIYFKSKNISNKVKIPEIQHCEDSDVTVAFICDEMTWCDYAPFVNAIFLHPYTWRKQLDSIRPDFLFCESAWCGIDKYPNCWRGMIYKDHRLCFDNRKILLDIITYCNQNNIPTVYWNKEDPVYFHHSVYDFADTALYFDFVYTTAVECIELYQKIGCSNVGLLPFGVNTALFNSNKRVFKKKTAVFAGSWFSDQPNRCKALERLLDYVIAQGWDLDIYDRKFESTGKRFRFPVKYRKYIRPSVPYEMIPEICKKYEYAVNVNTVTESETMMSRRLLQMAACGIKVLSNTTAAQKNLRTVVTFKHIKKDLYLVTGDIDRIRKFYSTEIQFLNCIEQVVNENYKLEMK